MQRVSLLIPAYNEKATIEKVIQEQLDILLKLESLKYTQDFEMVILNDDSKDSTYSRALDLAKNSKKIRLLNNKELSGLQKAFNQLYKESQFE